MGKFGSPLALPHLIDLTKNQGKDIACIQITTGLHKFSPNAEASGKNYPLFGSIAYINAEKVSQLSFGLPFFKFKRDQRPTLHFINETGFSFDLHWHGLNTTGDIDGASAPVEFGADTKIGTKLVLNFPSIKNNSTLLWVHAHPMFLSSEFVYSGVYGLLQIVDDISQKVNDVFEYPNNHISLIYEDVDFTDQGILTSKNLNRGGQRSCFGLINGISCVNWYTKEKAKYTTGLYHKVTKNLVKIDILNGSDSFRYIYVGVCDKRNNIKQFYLIQTDNGLRNPTQLDIVAIAPGSRISLLLDMTAFSHGLAYIFFYNFDLTEISNLKAISPEDVESPLQGNIPDLNQSSNPTPNPTPIPGPSTQLDYPPVSLIPQITAPLKWGNQILPQKTNQPFTIKKFLKIKLIKDQNYQLQNEEKVVKNIRQVVFGKANYRKYKQLIAQNNFEYRGKINYLSLLNKNYFYNLPNVCQAPSRNYILFFDNNQNSNVPGGNPYGTTEYIFDASRIITDLWNSAELDLTYALTQYNLSPNNYQPKELPTCLFKIYPTDGKYMNYDMLANDTLTIQFFSQPIKYGDTSLPIASSTIVFPTTNKPLNINQWKSLVNSSFDKTTVTLNRKTVKLSDILTYDWSFYPFRQSYITKKSIYLKSVMLKTTNNSPYYLKFLGRWPLLQFFGKPMSAMPMASMCACGPNCKCDPCPCGSDCKCDPCQCKKTMCSCGPGCKCDPCTCDKMMCPCGPGCKCDPCNCEKMPMMNNYNMKIQQIYPQYGTDDPQNPITTYDNNAVLIIKPKSQYLGLLDGFQSDSLMNFSVQLDSSEKWIYHNLDTFDSHPFHFHLTSGFVDVFDCDNSPGLVSKSNNYSSYIYSKDTYGIGPQQTIAFYLKFSNYKSSTSVFCPPIRNLGFMYHCHFMLHHDMNMMGEYFVYKKKDKFF